MNEVTIKKFENAGLYTYKPDAIYDDDYECLGLTVTCAGRTITGGTFHGAPIRAEEAEMMLSGKIWVDEDSGELMSENADPALVEEARSLYEKIVKAAKDEYDQNASQYKGAIQLQYHMEPNYGGGNAFDAMYIQPFDAEKLFVDLYPDIDPNDLYAEIEIEDEDWDEEAECERPEADQRHHDELLSTIRERAEEMGIPSCIFRPWWDN